MSKTPSRRALGALIAVPVALAAVVGTSAVADAKGGPTPPPATPLHITAATPTPGAVDVPAGSDIGVGEIDIDFSAALAHTPGFTVINNSTRKSVTASAYWWDGASHLTFYADVPTGTGYQRGLLPGTTYTVKIGGKNAEAAVSTEGAVLSGSDVGGVTVSKGVATYTFTTAPAS